MRVEWKVHRMKAYMMTSYLLLVTFLINWIQALQYQWKRCMDPYLI